MSTLFGVITWLIAPLFGDNASLFSMPKMFRLFFQMWAGYPLSFVLYEMMLRKSKKNMLHKDEEKAN